MAIPRKRCKHCKGWLLAERVEADPLWRPIRIFRRSITLLSCPRCDAAPAEDARVAHQHPWR